MPILTGKLQSVGGTPFGGPGCAVLIYSRITRPGPENSMILELQDHIEMPTENEGAFTSESMPAGPIRVMLEGDDVHGQTWDITLPPGEETVELTDLVETQIDWSPEVVSRSEAAARKAETAQTGSEAARNKAVSAASTAGQHREAAEQARDQAVSDVTSARDQATGAVTSARNTAISDVTSARGQAVTVVESTRDGAVSAVQTAKTEAVSDVEGRRDSVVADVNAAGNAANGTISGQVTAAQQAASNAGTAAGAAAGSANLADQRATAAEQARDDVQAVQESVEWVEDRLSVMGELGPPLSGEDGVTPQITAGTATTLPAGSAPTVEVTGPAEAPVINLGVPLPARSPRILIHTGTGDPVLANFPDAQVGDIIQQRDSKNRPTGAEWKVDPT